MPEKTNHDPACGRTLAEVALIGRALDELRSARSLLHRAGARQSYERIARDVKSVEGALRHAERQRHRAMGDCAACALRHADDCTFCGPAL